MRSVICVLNLAFGLQTKWGQIGYVQSDHLAQLRAACSKYNKPLFACLNSFCGMVNVGCHENAKSVLFEIDSIKDLP